MPLSPDQLRLLLRFSTLFTGYERAHGRHRLLTAEEDGKVAGRASTIPQPADEETFAEHLLGVDADGEVAASLGVIPIMEDNRCVFGAIDLDIRGSIKLKETLEDVERRVNEMKLPLVACRSKSGGVHLYLFTQEPVSATLLQNKLHEFSAALGYGGAEVFPKQTSRVNENDRGNWINLCYFGGLSEAGSIDRYSIKDGKPLTLEQFLDVAESAAISEKALRAAKVHGSDLFSDGPPCLQQLASLQFTKGGRNISLANIATYFKKKNPDGWQDDVAQFNFSHFQPPLPTSEVNQILKNLSRKEYFYTCKQSPLSNYCNRKECRKRDYGIGEMPEIGEVFPLENLTQYRAGDSVRWCAEFQGKRLEFTTDQLLSPDLMQKIFLEQYTTMIRPVKRAKWHEHVAELLKTVEVVDDPEDASRDGQFRKLLDNFLTNTRPARDKEEILKGNSWGHGGRVYFRSEDLFNYLAVRRFICNPQEAWSWLREMGGKGEQMRIKGKMTRLWSIAEPERIDGSDLNVPAMDEEF